MSIKRLLPGRWVRIIGWTVAGVSWGTTAVAVAAGAGQPTTTPATTATETTTTTIAVAKTAVAAALPEAPADGLVILRFTPAPRPEAQVITRTVVSSSGGGGVAQQPSQPVVVRSSGS